MNNGEPRSDKLPALAYEHAEASLAHEYSLEDRHECFREWVEGALGRYEALKKFSVDTICGETGLFSIIYYSCDIDLPIPLVMELDLFTRLALRSLSGDYVGDLTLRYNEETYDISYGLDLTFEETDKNKYIINHWPDWPAEKEEEMLTIGLDRLKRLLKIDLADEILIEILANALAPYETAKVLRAHLDTILKRMKAEKTE